MKNLFVSLLLTAFFAACDKDDGSDVFYSDAYPVDSVGATVEIAADPDIPDSLQTENPLIQQIKDDILANAPVRAGGSYTLDFTRYNGGSLTVQPDAASEALTGTFIKNPEMQDSLYFAYADRLDSCYVYSYQDPSNKSKVMLRFDLTRQYQATYPDESITAVTRSEYTSHPYPF